MRRTSILSFLIASMFSLFVLLSCSQSKKTAQYTIGFSQVTVKEPWRVVFNEKLREQAEAQEGRVDLIMLDADDKTENQVEHIRTFISKRVDAILISPIYTKSTVYIWEMAVMINILNCCCSQIYIKSPED